MKKFEMYLYGIIGAGQDNGAVRFVNEHTVLEALASMPDDTEEIHIRMQSPGGSVDSATAILALLQSKGKRLVGHIDGLAASAMTLISSGMDYTYIHSGARMMIHNPKGGGMNDAEGKVKEAEYLSAVTSTMVQSYMKRTKLPEETIRAWMKAETWFNASDAVRYGFADEIESSGAMKIAAIADDYSDYLSQFENLPDDLKIRNNMQNIIAAVGLANSADEAAVIAKINDIKAQLADKNQLITDLTAKVAKSEGQVSAVQTERDALATKLAEFEATEVRARVQAETGYLVGAEATEKLTRRVQRYITACDDTAKADAYEDLKAFCIANGVKGAAEIPAGGQRPAGSDKTETLIAQAEKLASDKKITFSEAYRLTIQAQKEGN